MPDVIDLLRRYGEATESAARSAVARTDGAAAREVRPEDASSPKRRWPAVLVAAILLVAAGIAGVVLLQHDEPEGENLIAVDEENGHTQEGLTWERIDDPFDGGFPQVVAAHEGTLLAVGHEPTDELCPIVPAGGFACASDLVSWTSADGGRTWAQSGTLMSDAGAALGPAHVGATGLVWHDGRWYVAGPGGDGGPAVWVSSDDGTTWTGGPLAAQGGQYEPNSLIAGLAVAEGEVIAVGTTRDAERWWRPYAWSITPEGGWDHLVATWGEAGFDGAELSGPVRLRENPMGVAATGSRIVAVGAGPDASPYRWSSESGGGTWSGGTIADTAGWARDVASAPGGFLAGGVSGSAAAVWTSPDGTWRWTPEEVEEPPGDDTEPMTGISDIAASDKAAVALQEGRRMVYERASDDVWRPVDLLIEDGDQPIELVAAGDIITLVGYGAAWIASPTLPLEAESSGSFDPGAGESHLIGPKSRSRPGTSLQEQEAAG